MAEEEEAEFPQRVSFYPHFPETQPACQCSGKWAGPTYDGVAPKLGHLADPHGRQQDLPDLQLEHVPNDDVHDSSLLDKDMEQQAWEILWNLYTSFPLIFHCLEFSQIRL